MVVLAEALLAGKATRSRFWLLEIGPRYNELLRPDGTKVRN